MGSLRPLLHSWLGTLPWDAQATWGLYTAPTGEQGQRGQENGLAHHQRTVWAGPEARRLAHRVPWPACPERGAPHMAGKHTSRARAGGKQKEGVVPTAIRRPATEAPGHLCELNTSTAPLVFWAEGETPSLPIVCQQGKSHQTGSCARGRWGRGTYPGGGGARPLVHGACGRRGSKRRASAAS